MVKKGLGMVSKTSMVGHGFFEEFAMKKLEAEQRLARVFAAFVKLQPIGGYFIFSL